MECGPAHYSSRACRWVEIADHRHHLLLRTKQLWRCHRATQEEHQLAALHFLIPCSANQPIARLCRASRFLILDHPHMSVNDHSLLVTPAAIVGVIRRL
jgi:hypothetical protein